MKKLASYLLVILFVGTLASCGGGDAKKDIVGTWKLDKMDLGEEIPAEQKAMFDAMMVEMKKNFVMTFKDDGTMETKKDAEGEAETGKYSISEDGKTLSTDSNGKKESITIVSISSSKMVLEVAEGGKKMKMTLVK